MHTARDGFFRSPYTLIEALCQTQRQESDLLVSATVGPLALTCYCQSAALCARALDRNERRAGGDGGTSGILGASCQCRAPVLPRRVS